MKIMMIWDADYPWDVRVEKVCKTLVSDGHEVHLVSRNLAQNPVRETIDGIEIHRLPTFKKLTKAFNAAISFPAFFSPLWIWKIYQTAKRTHAGLIIVRDLPMCLAGILIAKILRIPVILDMAECYPEMLRCIWKFEDFKIRNLLIRNPYFADVVERLAIKHLDAIWVMVEESADRLTKMRFPEEKIFIVSNTPSIRENTEASMQRDRPVVAYIGLLNPSRGVRTLIQAAAILKKKNIPIEFIIVGSGKELNDLKVLSKTLDVDDIVDFKGWVERKLAEQIISAADIGIVPHYRCTHWNNTIPNKLFDYMHLGIPVITSNTIPSKRVVEETQCGLVYRDDDPADLAEKLCLLQDKNTRNTLGHNGREAILKRYRWDYEKESMIRSLTSLRSSSSSKPSEGKFSE